MMITLSSKQVAWLEEQVRRGVLPSVEEGVREAVARMMPPDLDDLEWVRPYLDEARASVVRGEVVTHQQFKSVMAGHIERLGRIK